MRYRRAAKVGILLALLVVSLFLFRVRFHEYVIVRTDEGFVPSSIRIFPGALVKFVNKTSKPIWPASDLHPSHSLYAAFDSHTGIAPDDWWQFRFDKNGTWSFHDHLDPGVKGSIRVSFIPAELTFYFVPTTRSQNRFESCIVSAPDEGGTCWERVATHLVRSQGVARTMEDLAKIFPDNSSAQEYCHDVTHTIGHEAYYLHKDGKAVTFTQQQAMCSWGFFHGFMEQMLQDGGDLTESAELCNTILDENIDTTNELINNCYHGMGHGSVLRHEEDPSFDFWKILEVGIISCEQASDEIIYTLNCVSGVIDGLLASVVSGAYPIPDDVAADPYQICRRFDAYKRSCYSATNWFLLHFSKNNFPKMAAYVETIPDEAIAKDTMHWLANLEVRLLEESDEKKPAEWCLSVGSSFQSSCMTGFALGYLMNKGIPGKEYLKAIDFCSQENLTQTQSHDCYNAVIDYVGDHEGVELAKHICDEYSLHSVRSCSQLYDL